MRAADPAEPAEDQAWVTVATLEDPLEAELLTGVFREAEIPVAMPGTQHRAMLGVLGGYVHIPVQVPHVHALEARQLVDAYRLSHAHAPAEPALSTAASTLEEATPPRVERSPKSAVGVSLLGAGVLASVGAGHAYVRQYLAAAVLFALGWTAAAALFMGYETWPALRGRERQVPNRPRTTPARSCRRTVGLARRAGSRR